MSAPEGMTEVWFPSGRLGEVIDAAREAHNQLSFWLDTPVGDFCSGGDPYACFYVPSDQPEFVGWCRGFLAALERC